jgi:ketosteroid isomerase-like protein
MRTIALVLAVLAMGPLVASAAPPAKSATIEKEIVALEEAMNNAYAANDLPKYFGFYAEDVSAIFYNERTTLPAYRTMWTAAVRTDPIEAVSTHDMLVRVSAAADVAIASYRIDVRTAHAQGPATDEHAFETDIWERRGGAWKVVHVQYSPSAK